MEFTKPLLTATKALVGVALCVGSVPAMANPACALSLQGCVLPVQDVVTTTPVTTTTPVIVDDVDTGGGLGILPIIAGLAALGALAWLLLDDDDDPESP